MTITNKQMPMMVCVMFIKVLLPYNYWLTLCGIINYMNTTVTVKGIHGLLWGDDPLDQTFLINPSPSALTEVEKALEKSLKQVKVLKSALASVYEKKEAI